ncbi:hypothetical protein [Limnochorda pilosa]|uniref:Uncharacterized protein n=1 Tax=Limnochorda pilosa TaxID=1555112 RepID=A0A0K2SI01_LIMPI|nr:hypothetical protein [Limnochorda pilosa]BAS26751.1 hypothetical protein LIP_0894 [Limnochorda pilosa]
MKPVNLPELRAQFAGTRFWQLVQHHLRRQSQGELTQGVHGTVALLPEAARDLAEEFIDRWNARVYDRSFWQRDTADVFDEIIGDARSVLRPLGLATDEEAAFNLFNIVVLSYAYSAYDQPKMREFMGIERAAFPWPSALALLYPVGAAIYIATTTPAGSTMVIGYGIANLGYLLFAAGILGGSFRILGLRNRWQVFGAAVISFVAGSMLSNVGA